MATAQTLINRALRLLGVIPAGASPTAVESADALTALNAMVESWRNESLMAYAHAELTLTLASSTASYTIGPSGGLTTTRPVAIESAYILASNISYAVRLLDTRAQYSAIADKTTTADWPSVAFYEPLMANGTLYVYPCPNATRTMQLLAVVPVTEFALVSTTVSLPPGWEQALAYNLAPMLAPEYQTQAQQEVIAEARNSKAAIKQRNSTPIPAYSELVYLVGGGRRTNIITNG